MPRALHCRIRPETSTARGAAHVLRYVLDHGADVEKLCGKDVLPTIDEFNENEKPSMGVLEILVSHGWDINTRGESWPLLWFVIRYSDLVQWCLDRGARVDFPDSPPRLGYSYNPPQFSADGTEIRHPAPRGPVTILGVAASVGSVETFELLRARGAPLDPRTLHIALQSAAMAGPNVSSEGSQGYKNRMAMVRHLIDIVRVDVNAIAHQVADDFSTPLCYLSGPRQNNKGHRGFINLLLDRGADPDLDCGPEVEVCPYILQTAQQTGKQGLLKRILAYIPHTGTQSKLVSTFQLLKEEDLGQIPTLMRSSLTT